MQRVESVFQSFFFLNVVSFGVKQFSRAINDGAFRFVNQRRDSIFVSLQKSRDIEIFPVLCVGGSRRNDCHTTFPFG